MPNLILEYSNSVDERVNVQGLLEDLHQEVLSCGLFEKSSVKSRAIRYHNWLVGEHNDSQDFIHLRIELLEGRSIEQKTDLSQRLINALAELASHVHSLTVDVREMEKASFQRVLNS
ncbi:5-carboxymethyl-2-hydroxymuconate Delta-isomerase [Vibrio profundum]|uniref:5-carboxymethyl-2-hydroxymuconate Delta-isomerase n=1 Tax=Vibrio profundum TaxID=2910247 RepID=UPI003D0CB3CC